MRKIFTKLGKSLALLGAVALMGTVSANAQTDMGSFTEKNNTYVKVEPSQNGYILLTFESPVDLTGSNGAAFYIYKASSYGADESISALETNGTDAGTQTDQVYGNYTGYTGVTKALYQVDANGEYCVWYAPAAGTIEFYTDKPEIGGTSGGDDEGVSMGEFTEKNSQYVKVEPSQNGYILLTFESTVDLTGSNGAAFYIYKASSYGADESISAIETNGTDAGTQTDQVYGNYTGYTGVTKALYQVEANGEYCVWYAPAAGTITFYTDKPEIGGTSGGGSTEPEPDVINELTLNEPFQATKNQKFWFENKIEGNVLTVTVNKDITEDVADQMIKANENFSGYFVCKTYSKAESGTEWIITYNMTKAQKYYFQCPADATYTFNLPDEDPNASLEESPAVASLEANINEAGQITILQVTWTLDDALQSLTAGSLAGAKLTGPDGNSIAINNYEITKEKDDAVTNCRLNIIISYTEYPDAAGEYTLTLPKGIVLIDGKASAAETLKYNYEKQAAPSYIDANAIVVSPFADYFLNSVENVTITFPAAVSPIEDTVTEITVSVNGEDVTVEITEPTTTLVVPVNATYAADLTEVEISLEGDILQDADENINPALAFTYYLADYNEDYTLNPADNSTFEDDTTITLTWNGSVNLNCDLDDLGIKLTDATGKEVVLIYDINWEFTDDDNGLVFNLEGNLPGEYTLSVPAGTLVIANGSEYTINPDIQATYIIPENDEVISGTFNLVFTGGEGVENAYQYVTIVKTTIDNEGELATSDFEVKSANESVEFDEMMMLTINPKEGYAVTVSSEDALGGDSAELANYPEDGYSDITIYGSRADGYTFTVKVEKSTGVNGINVANGENVIYNLQGVRVANPVKGVYIVNGKKVVVK